MKTKSLLIAAAMLLCLSAASFAQQIYTTSSTPITTVIATGNAEAVGNITFTGNANTPVSGTIGIQYGGNNVNITTNWSVIRVCTNAAGNVADASCPAGTGTFTGLQVNTNASSYSPGLLTIDVPANAALANSYFTVVNVRVQINGTGLTTLVANISATGNLIAAGSTVLTVINSTTGQGIASATSYTSNTGGSPTIPIDFTGTAFGTTTPAVNAVNGSFTDGGASGRTVAIVVKEGFLAAWGKGVGVRITLSATPPKGVSFTFPGSATSYSNSGTAINANWVRGGSTSWANTGSTTSIDSSSTSSSSLQVYYYVATDTTGGPVNIEYLEIPVTINTSTSSMTFPLAPKVYSYTVTLAPVRDAYDSDGIPRLVGTPAGSTSNSPRFSGLPETAAQNLLTIGGSNTVLFIPYAYATKTVGDFNTGVTISNTTEDPGTAILGFTGAVPQSGPITFYLFPLDTTLPMFTYKTVAGTPGTGLDSSGNIPSGGSYYAYLSQIFPLATPPAGSTATLSKFEGYVMIVCNFTNGHGIYVITNASTLTLQSGIMQVLSDRSIYPER